MTISYTITQDDYVRFNLFHMKNSPSQKRMVLFLQMLFPIMLFLLFAITKPSGTPVFFWAIVAALSAIWVFVVPRSVKRSTRRQVLRLLREGRGNGITGDYTLALQDAHIIETGEFRRTEIPYSGIERVVHDDACLYIYIGSIVAIIVPFSAFKDESEKQLFLERIQEKTKI